MTVKQSVAKKKEHASLIFCLIYDDLSGVCHQGLLFGLSAIHFIRSDYCGECINVELKISKDSLLHLLAFLP